MMPSSTTQVFDEPNFRAESYVKGLVQDCVGGAELQNKRTEIQTISDQTSSLLKKHVYENYMQFIGTSKEISHLESEMYQLSHILVEQRNLLAKLRESGIVADPTIVNMDGGRLSTERNGSGDGVGDNDDEDNIPGKSSLQESSIDSNVNTIDLIQEQLVGYTGSLAHKTYIHDGALIELDSTDYRPICRTHLFLFNDLLIVAKVKHDKTLAFLTEYETRKLAMINIRDLDGLKNAINLMTPDGSRIFQCINAAAKSEWIEKYEVSVKFNQKPKKGPAPAPPTAKKQSPPPPPPVLSPQPSVDLSPVVEVAPLVLAPDWLATAPEEIQSLIAQRHFEDALALVQRSEEFLATAKEGSRFHNAVEIELKVRDLKAQLSAVLLGEISSNGQSAHSLNSALRSARRPLKLLAEMRKAREACGALLCVCTTAIRTAQRQARRNNLEVSELFFCDLAQVVNDFLKAFHSQAAAGAACTSALVLWCNLELQYFATQLIKHKLVVKGAELDAVAKVVEGVRVPCGKLTAIGLNLSDAMEGLLRSPVEAIVEDARNRLVKTIARTEDVWRPHNLQSQSELRKLLREHEALGLDLRPYVTGDTWIGLSQSTISFGKQFINLTDSCATLAKNETLKGDVERLLRDVFLAQMAIKPSQAVTVEINMVAKNKGYLTDVLLPVAVVRFEHVAATKSDILNELMMQSRAPPKPKPRSIYQTEVL